MENKELMMKYGKLIRELIDNEDYEAGIFLAGTHDGITTRAFNGSGDKLVNLLAIGILALAEDDKETVGDILYRIVETINYYFENEKGE